MDGLKELLFFPKFTYSLHAGDEIEYRSFRESYTATVTGNEIRDSIWKDEK